MSQLLDSYLEAGSWSPTTRYGYGRLAEREIEPALGSIRLEDLRPDRIDRMYRKMRRDVTAASRRLGHSRKSTTLHLYVHGDVERDRAAAEVMGRLLGQGPGRRQELPDGRGGD